MPRSLLKPHAPLFLAGMKAADLLLAASTGAVAFRVRFGTWAIPERYALVLLLGVFAVLAVFPAMRLYEAQRGASLVEDVRRLILAWCVIAAILASALFATGAGAAFSRGWLLTWLAASLAGTALLRLLVRTTLRALRRRGRNLRHVVIVGAGQLGERVGRALAAASWSGFRVAGYFDDDAARAGSTVAGVPVMGSPDRMGEEIERLGIDQVWIALPLRAEARIRTLVEALRDRPVEIAFVPDIYGFHLLNHAVREVAGFPVIVLTEAPFEGVGGVVKAAEDLVLGSVLLALLAPLMLAIAAGIRLSSPGPVIFRQERVTWGGKRFEILKFRTLPVRDSSADGDDLSAYPAAETRFGAFLRRHSLDELPQLLNVLRGEMSLVGPRPERPDRVERLRSAIPGYMQKHLVKAGMTGWAQVNELRGDTDLHERIRHDLYYIGNWSVWFDLRILLLTLRRVASSRSAR